jgi:Flp pilus assembly protein TadB
MMPVALAYGGALLVSGWLFSRGLAEAGHIRALGRLGHEPPAVPSLATRARLPLARVSADRRGVALVGSSLVGAVVGYRLVGPLGLAAGSIIGVIVVRAREVRAELMRRDLQDRQLGEAVVTVAAAVRAGMSLRQAVAEAAEGAEPPLRGELGSVVNRLETGEPLDAALSRLDGSLGLSDAALLVNALAVHRRTGGDLPALLDEIARVIRLRLEDRRAVRALTVQARSSGVVLAVLPVAFVALLSGTGGDGLGAFYRTPAGAFLLAAALILQALGFAWMRRIVRRIEEA